MSASISELHYLLIVIDLRNVYQNTARMLTVPTSKILQYFRLSRR
jgi:hypothetical protein